MFDFKSFRPYETPNTGLIVGRDLGYITFFIYKFLRYTLTYSTKTQVLLVSIG